MGLLTIALEVVAGLLKVLPALIELECSRRKRKGDHAEARRPRHLKK
jgi:hypothetical protein